MFSFTERDRVADFASTTISRVTFPLPSTSDDLALGAIGTRLISVDAYRGFVMMALAIEGYIPAVAQRFPNSSVWQFFSQQFVHVDWQGGVFWDLIQPSFMFIVGVAIPFSYFSRRSKGDSSTKIAVHVAFRAALLVMLGLLLRTGTLHNQRTVFEFDDILSQIGLAYPFAYLLVDKTPRVQLLVAAVILGSYWLVFYLFPAMPADFNYAALGISNEKPEFTGLFAHWNKYTNFATAFDRWFLNLFPRPKEFLFHPAGLATLNFIPSIATLIFGIMAGELLRGSKRLGEKCLRLCSIGLSLFGLGLLAGYTVCPIIKAIWTPSWVLVSTGFTLWLLAAFYWIADVKGWKRLMAPLSVVGMNSMVMYLMIRLFRDWLSKVVEIHGRAFSWSMQFAMVTLILWLVCYWMYRSKIFVRL